MKKFSVVYYTNADMDESPNRKTMQFCFENLVQSVASDGEIIAVTPEVLTKTYPNVTNIIHRSTNELAAEDVYVRFLKGLGFANTPYIFTAEWDIVYNAEYFKFMVDQLKAHKPSLLLYNTNVIMCNKTGFFKWNPIYVLLSDLAGHRSFIKKAIEKKYALITKYGYAGIKNQGEPLDSFERVEAPIPTINIRNGYNLTGDREPEDDSYYIHEIPGIGNWYDFVQNI